VYSILFQNGTLIRPASTRFVIDCSRTPVPRNRFVQVGVYGGWIYGGGSGHEDSSHNILTLDALQVLSRSQVTPELSMSMRIRPICKKAYIHTSCWHGVVHSSLWPCSTCQCHLSAQFLPPCVRLLAGMVNLEPVQRQFSTLLSEIRSTTMSYAVVRRGTWHAIVAYESQDASGQCDTLRCVHRYTAEFNDSRQKAYHRKQRCEYI
jgi:hypothetical protein